MRRLIQAALCSLWLGACNGADGAPGSAGGGALAPTPHATRRATTTGPSAGAGGAQSVARDARPAGGAASLGSSASSARTGVAGAETGSEGVQETQNTADAPVVFTPAAGAFHGASVTVTLAARNPRAKLYYTLDNTVPTQASTPYRDPLTLKGTNLVRVSVYEPGAAGRTFSASYIQLGSGTEEFSSNLPVIVLHTLAGPAPDPNVYTRIPAIAQVRQPGGSGRTRLLDPPSLDTRIGIKVRGLSTRHQPKHSYTIELRDQRDADASLPLLGLPEESDWVLHAPYELDRSLLRNAFWYALSRSIGRYAPRTRFCEVFLAQKGKPLTRGSYLGIYVLTETIKRDKQRVDIQKQSPSARGKDSLTGGYIVSVDFLDPGDQMFNVEELDRQVRILYPKDEVRSAAHTKYIIGFLNSVGRALKPRSIDAAQRQAREDLMDLNSFIDHHILNTFVMNPDSFRLSEVMHKDRNGKLKAGPVWDADRAMGSYDVRDDNPEQWFGPGGTAPFLYGWWGKLFADPEFEARYWKRLTDLEGGALSIRSMLALVDSLAEGLDEAASRNTSRWSEAAPRGGDFRNEVADLKTWLTRRAAWVRTHHSKL